MDESCFVMGVDLGQMRDFTAVCVAERTVQPNRLPTYAVRSLKRFPLGTSYPQIVEDVTKTGYALRGQMRTMIAVDQTGVGAPVVQMLRQKIAVSGVVITAGNSCSFDRASDTFRVAKIHLISAMQVLLHSGRLQISKKLPEAETLVEELLSFQVKNTAAGNEQYESWRERAHDDLVLALGLAVWVGYGGLPRRAQFPRHILV